MAKVSGLEGFDHDVKALSSAEAEQHALEACDLMGRTLEQQILANYRAMVGREYASGLLENSITYTAKPSELKEGAFGGAGVYHITGIAAQLGDPDKIISAPTRAYWIEFGTQPHSLASGARARRRGTKHGTASDGRDQSLGTRHPGTKAVPFITAAQDAKTPEMLDIARDEYNRFIDEVILRV